MAKKTKQDLAAIGILVCSVSVFFADALFSKNVFFHGDIGWFNAPYRFFLHYSVQNGTSPLWCPNIFNGYPLYASPQLALFYPFNWAFFTSTPPLIVYKYILIIHYLLAGAFTYLYARRVNLSFPAALFSSLTFTFSGFMVTHLEHMNIINAAVWLPLILFFLEIAIQKHRRIYAMLSGFFFSLQFFAGHPQISFYTALAVILYLAAVAIATNSWKNALSILLIFFLVAGGIAAIQILPTFELSQETLRYQFSRNQWSWMTSMSLSPKDLVRFFLPNIYGTPLTSTYNPIESNYWESCGFVGISSILLFLISFLSGRSRIPRYFAFLAIFSIIMALGKVNQLYYFLVHVPVWNYFKDPGRYLYLFTFAVALGAGYGIQALTDTKLIQNQVLKVLSKKTSHCFYLFFTVLFIASLIGVFMFFLLQNSITDLIHRYDTLASINLNLAQTDSLILLAVTTCGMIVSGLFWKQRIKEYIFHICLIGLVTFELFCFGIGYNPLTTPDFYDTPPSTATFLKADDPSLFGVFVHSSFSKKWSHWGEDQQRFFHATEFLKANYNILHNVRLVAQGYGALLPMRHLNVASKMHLNTLVESPSASKWLGTFNAKYIITNKDFHSSDFTLVHETEDFFMFSLDLEFRTDLDSGDFSENLRQEFHRNGIQLSANVNISTKKAACEWSILDRDNKLPYLIKNEKDILGTYQNVKIYRNENWFGRCNIVRNIQVMQFESQVLDMLDNPSFNPKTQAILEEEPLFPQKLHDLSALTEQNDKLVIIKETQSEITIETDTLTDGLLTLSDSYYPGWKAFIDRVETKVYRANYISRAVWLPKGKHTVRFVYTPRFYAIGKIITIISVICIVSILLISLRTKS